MTTPTAGGLVPGGGQDVAAGAERTPRTDGGIALWHRDASDGVYPVTRFEP